MEATSRYAVPDEVLTAHLEGEAVLLHMDTKNYFRLNATAALLWKGMERGLERGQLLDSLLAEFEVDRPTAAAELDRLLGELAERGLVVPG
jgi:hypothetical protein